MNKSKKQRKKKKRKKKIASKRSVQTKGRKKEANKCAEKKNK